VWHPKIQNTPESQKLLYQPMLKQTWSPHVQILQQNTATMVDEIDGPVDKQRELTD
jgi:hypothetical protein